MVLAVYNHEGRGSAEELQRREHLYALAYWHIGVGVAVEEEQRSVDLLGIEQRALVHIEVLARPRIAVGHRHLAVAVAPIALAPIAGVVADAGMGYGAGEDVGLRLEILGHKASVACSYATHLGAVGEGVVAAERLRGLDDVFGNALTRCVDVARRELLTKAHGSARVDHQHHIAGGGIYVMGITRLEIAARGRAAAVIVDDDGIALRGIEARRQIIAAGDGVATAAHKRPRLATAKHRTFHVVLVEFFQKRRLARSGVEAIETVAVARALALPQQLGRVVSQGYLVDHVLRLLHLRDGAAGRVAFVKMAIVAVVGGEPDVAVGFRPFVGVHAGVKQPRQGVDLARGNVQGVELIVVHAWRAVFGHVLAHSAKTLGRTHDDDLAAVGRELRARHEPIVLHETFSLQRGEVHAPDGDERCGACGKPASGG